MPGDENVNELFAEHKLLERVRCKVGTSIANQKAQLRWQQDTQRFDDHFSSHSGTSHKQWQAQALSCAVVDDDQDGDPIRDDRQLRPVLPEFETL